MSMMEDQINMTVVVVLSILNCSGASHGDIKKVTVLVACATCSGASHRSACFSVLACMGRRARIGRVERVELKFYAREAGRGDKCGQGVKKGGIGSGWADEASATQA